VLLLLDTLGIGFIKGLNEVWDGVNEGIVALLGIKEFVGVSAVIPEEEAVIPEEASSENGGNWLSIL